MRLRHVTKISSLTRSEVFSIIKQALEMKARPGDYTDALKHRSLLMLFEKPSLRTRVSLEVGMTQMGGHALAYMMDDSPIGSKETYEDTGAVISTMVDAVTARVASRKQTTGLARTSGVPVVNALDDFAHPMQVLADLVTICEQKCGGDPHSLRDICLAFVGDCQNNVTYDLMRAGSLMGFEVRLAGPRELAIEAAVLDECCSLGLPPRMFDTAIEAVTGADIVYADSWMSYGVHARDRDRRLMMLKPFQVDSALLQCAKPNASFMNCLPAMRGEEQTADVIDGQQSIVFQQAENRLHAQKSLLLKVMTATF
mmetsp:Transcript_25497/g.101617  ORF Transcript_25497/g.101617 Transcript_25497/m.101617 type:complete len:312 (-) Transcript_25497:730-1665(-)